MNPINVINQEFTRVVIAEWSEEAQSRQAQGLVVARGRGTVAQALLGWLSEMIRRVAGVGRAGYRPTLGETRK